MFGGIERRGVIKEMFICSRKQAAVRTKESFARASALEHGMVSHEEL